MKKTTSICKFAAAVLAAVITASCTATAASAKTVLPSGDYDRDGSITSNDAVGVLRVSVGKGHAANTTLTRSDLDGDESLTSNDAVGILRTSVGLEEGETLDSSYTVNDGVNDFSAEIFKQCWKYDNESGSNTFVSPFSVYSALAMLQNGADSNTSKEMLSMLAQGKGTTENINDFMRNYITTINGGDILRTANAMFLLNRDDVTVNEDFTNAIKNNYFAEIFKGPANDDTVDKINDWTKKNTKDMIDKILDHGSLTEESLAVLLNAVSFEAQWYDQYEKYQIKKDVFHNYNGTNSTVDFLCGEEKSFISDELSRGFIKDYRTEGRVDEQGNWSRPEEYSFVTILPNEGVSIDDYIAQMDDATIKELVHSEKYRTTVDTKMPKFKYDCKYDMNDMLRIMGMESAFNANGDNPADLSKLATSNYGYNVYVKKVLHKTHIELDENGTKAAAVTAIMVDVENCADMDPHIEIVLDRPYIFAIYDKVNDIPIFIGAIRNL